MPERTCTSQIHPMDGSNDSSRLWYQNRSRFRPTTTAEQARAPTAMVADIQWRNPPLDVPGVPVFIARDALPDPATARCELCDRRRERFKVGGQGLPARDYGGALGPPHGRKYRHDNPLD